MTKEQVYEEALVKISSYHSGNPMKWPTPQEAAEAMVQIADTALHDVQWDEATADEPGSGPMPWNPETSTNISIHEQTPEKSNDQR